jgi:hypothetical protein
MEVTFLLFSRNHWKSNFMVWSIGQPALPCRHEYPHGKIPVEWFMSIDNKKLAVVHILKKELNLSDDEYRDILQQAAGVRSAKDLDEANFRKLMRYFVRSKYYRINPFGLTLKQKLYITYMAREMGWDEGHLNNFIHKYYHKSRVDELTKKEAVKAIESLKNVRQHQK